MLYQPPPREAYSPPHISIDGTKLNAVEHFTYLGSVIFNDGTVSKGLDNRLSKASGSFGRLSKSMADSLAPPLHKDPGLQSCRSHSPVRCRDLGSLSEVDQATGAVSPTLLTLHPWHQMARPRVQESQPAQHRVHLASGAASLGWPHHKDRRHTRAQSSLLQRAARRKARSWCSKRALQRPAEETTCTSVNQLSDIAAGGLRPRQMALISEKSQL